MSKERFNQEMMDRIHKRDPEALAYVDAYVEEHGDCEESRDIREIGRSMDFDRRSFEAGIVYAANTATIEMVASIELDEVDPDCDISVDSDAETEKPDTDWEATGDEAVVAALEHSRWSDQEYLREDKIQLARNVISRITDAVARKMGVSPHLLSQTEAGDCPVSTMKEIDQLSEPMIETFHSELKTKIDKQLLLDFIRTTESLTRGLEGSFTTGSNRADPLVRTDAGDAPCVEDVRRQVKEMMLTRVGHDFSEARAEAVKWEEEQASRIVEEAQRQDDERAPERVNIEVHAHDRQPDPSGSYSPFTVTVEGTIDRSGRNLSKAMTEVVRDFPQFTVQGCELRSTVDAADDMQMIQEVVNRAAALQDKWEAEGSEQPKNVKTLTDLKEEW